MDTYKVGTVANSTSTMHKLASTPITLDCFEMDDFSPLENYKQEYTEVVYYNGDTKQFKMMPTSFFCEEIKEYIAFLENLRLKYLETKDQRYWKELIRWLPESWLQTRTWTANYAVLRNIIHWRKGHKLSEWAQFLDWCHQLPYAEELLFFEN